MTQDSLRDRLLFAAKGFCMGAADVVPGVSGGTMALILGIYARLIDAIRSFDLAWLGLLARGRFAQALRYPDLGFLVPLGIGIFAALMVFTRVIPLPVLVRTQPELVYGLFFGLIAGSIVLLTRQLEAMHARSWLQLAAGTVLGLAVVNLVPMATSETAGFVFLSGALAISAMLLPGISGSFILLILKKYAYIFEAVGRLDLAVLLPFILGMATGLVLFSRVLSWLIHHYYQASMRVIIGLLTGSLWVIWPFQQRVYETVAGKEKLLSTTPVLPPTVDGQVLFSIALIAAGLALVLLLGHLARHQVSAERTRRAQ